MDLSPRILVTSAVQLISLPEIFIRLNERVNDPRSSAKDIGRVLEKDTALSTRLLKVVNSPFYGLSTRIDTISRAITVVGIQELRDLALATVAAKSFTGLPTDLVVMEDFWRHSLYTAVLARAFAAQRRLLNTERFFVSGLLHDVGSLILYCKLPELAREALLRAQHNELIVHEAERQVLGFDHAAVGAELLRVWKLPSNLQEAVKYHHMPQHAQNSPVEAAIVHLANAVANAQNKTKNPSVYVPPINPNAWELAAIPPEALEPALADADRQFEQMHALIFGEG